ncbi:MAG: ATP-binding protein, partial [Chitinophagaceae bacterium]
NNMIASHPDTDNNYGHGLGMLIIRELVAATGGTMLIQSTPGAGTTITLRWHETSGEPVPAKTV